MREHTVIVCPACEDRQTCYPDNRLLTDDGVRPAEDNGFRFRGTPGQPIVFPPMPVTDRRLMGGFLPTEPYAGTVFGGVFHLGLQELAHAEELARIARINYNCR